MHHLKSKFNIYLASGCSVLFKGPHYASPAHFFEKNIGGVCCYSLETVYIIEKFNELFSNVKLYSEIAKMYEQHLKII